MPIELKIPAVGESITEVEIGDWRKNEGDPVQKDETVVVLESEKATVELPAPVAGTLARILKRKGETATIGEVIAHLDDSGGAPAQKAATNAEPKKEAPKAEKEAPKEEAQPRVMPAAQRVLAESQLTPAEIKATGPGGRLLKEDVLRHVESGPPASDGRQPSPASSEPTKTAAPTREATKAPVAPAKKELGSREEEVVPMSRLRRTVAERLVQAQHNAALLTTFNEIDMSAVMALRKQ